MLAAAVGLTFLDSVFACMCRVFYVLGRLAEVAFRRRRNKHKTVRLHGVIFEPGEGLLICLYSDAAGQTGLELFQPGVFEPWSGPSAER